MAQCGGWGKAKITPRVGGHVAMLPHITGEFLYLVPGRMIVQTWRSSNWKRSDGDSVLILTFHRVPGGCRPAMVHTNVPDAEAKSIGGRTGGRHGHYGRPLKAYLRTKRSR